MGMFEDSIKLVLALNKKQEERVKAILTKGKDEDITLSKDEQLEVIKYIIALEEKVVKLKQLIS